MRRHARSLIIIMLSLAAGAVVGPLLIAAAAAALGQESDGYGPGEAERLVDAYRDQLPRGHMFLSLAAPPDGEECGYNREIVRERSPATPSGGSRDAYSDYQGYAALNRWRGERRDEAWIRAITASIDERFSDFKIGFLRRCIESTLFAGLCANEVEQFGDTVPRFGRSGVDNAQDLEDRVVCTFVDGVAARKRIPLSTGGRVPTN